MVRIPTRRIVRSFMRCACFSFPVPVAVGTRGKEGGAPPGLFPQKARPSALGTKQAEDTPSGRATDKRVPPFETGAEAPFGRFSAVGLLVQIEIDAGAAPLSRRDGAG